ncbi:MAG: DUF2339 domain-containing protein [Sphingomonadales bacterium]|nr:DUF2339 domain-containing protein [Sphingomonadales bacterium]
MDGLAFIAAAVALFVAFGMRRKLTTLQAQLTKLTDELRSLRTEAAFARRSDQSPPAPEPQTPTPPADALAEPEPAGESEAEPDSTPMEAPAPPAAAPATTLEERLGTRWAVWIGGLALALGGVLLVRYSIEQGIFGPGVRVALGALFSLGLVVAGEWFRRTERAAPVGAIPAAHVPSILTAAGTISAFGTVYAAHALYQFIGPAAAFILLGAIGIATMFAAGLHGPALAGLGLAGSLVVPLLIESQQPNPWPLVIYLAVVAGAAYALARLRRWLWLAVATVAGAAIWGFALTEGVDLPGENTWASALLVHVAIQLMLAAVFVAIEPHLAVIDDAAEPDWIAAAALGVLTVLAVLALGMARVNVAWTSFVVVAMVILVATAWRSAPAAVAAAFAGVVALGGIAVWPGLKAPPDPQLLAPALEGVLRLPENVSQFLTFAALTTLAVGAVATLRLWRGRRLPVSTASLYALAAVVPPLLALVLAYLRVTQFDRSISFALFAVALVAVFYFVADRFDKIAVADKTPATHLAVGALASGVAAAMTLAFVMALDRGYLTVAFAVTAFTTARFAVVDRIPLLRYVVVALGLIVLGRLAWDPRIMGADVGTWPIFNWLLLGYGAPAVAFLAAGHILKREAEDLAVRICDALGVLFAALLVFFQIRHALNNGDPLAPISGHVEQGLFALTSLGFAAALIRMDLARANPVFRAASMIFGVISALITLFGLGVVENPLLSHQSVRGPVVFSSLLLAYLLPALAAIVLARIARGVRPGWYVTGAAVLALLLLFGYVTLEVRHAFQGELLTIWQSTGAPEIWSYSVAWLARKLHEFGVHMEAGHTVLSARSSGPTRSRPATRSWPTSAPWARSASAWSPEIRRR